MRVHWQVEGSPLFYKDKLRVYLCSLRKRRGFIDKFKVYLCSLKMNWRLTSVLWVRVHLCSMRTSQGFTSVLCLKMTFRIYLLFYKDQSNYSICSIRTGWEFTNVLCKYIKGSNLIHEYEFKAHIPYLMLNWWLIMGQEFTCSMRRS